MSLVYGFTNGRKIIDEAVVEEMLGDRQEFAVEASAPPHKSDGRARKKQNGDGFLFEPLVPFRST